MMTWPTPNPRARRMGPNPTTPLDLRVPSDYLRAPIVCASDNPGGSYVTRVTRARVRRHLPGFLLRRTRFAHDRQAVAASDLNAAACAVVALIDGEPWFTFEPGWSREPLTPLQVALCTLARHVHFAHEADDDEAHAAA